jgi:hypothetical protein
MSRVDSIFREGGGAETFAAMEAEVVALHQHHPNATAWLSPCGLDEVALVSAKKRPCLQFLQLLLLLRLLLLLFSKFDDLPRQVRDKRKKNPGGKHVFHTGWLACSNGHLRSTSLAARCCLWPRRTHLTEAACGALACWVRAAAVPR